MGKRRRKHEHCFCSKCMAACVHCTPWAGNDVPNPFLSKVNHVSSDRHHARPEMSHAELERMMSARKTSWGMTLVAVLVFGLTLLVLVR